jgi:hypothetical protein
MSLQYAGETVEELALIELPSKRDYIANLCSVEPPADEPTCAICRDAWDYPDLDVVAPSPHCIQHPVHKECLLICFATEDGEEVSNLCPFCRRELFEKITSPQLQDETSEYETPTTGQYYAQLGHQSQAFYFETLSGTPTDDADNVVNDSQLLYPGGPTIAHALQTEDFWSVLPRFLENWFIHNATPIVVDTFTFQSLGDLMSPEATRLTEEGRAAITALLAHEKVSDRFELSLKTVELLNHQYGELVMRCIGAAFKYYDDSAFPKHVGVLQRESHWLVAYYVLMSLLTIYKHYPYIYEQDVDLSQWLALIRLRKMLYEEITQWASNTFFARLLPVKFILDYGSFLGNTTTEHDPYEIEMLHKYADGTTKAGYMEPDLPSVINRDAILYIKEDADYAVNKHFEDGAVIHFYQPGIMVMWELNPGFFHDFAYDPEKGFLDLEREHGFTMRIKHRVAKV